jgi:hypothetical protein
MRVKSKRFLALVFACSLLSLLAVTMFTSKAAAVNAKFDPAKMSDMSDYDPGNPVIPSGDTIKIGVVAAFSGPGSLGGEVSFFSVQ